MAGEAATMTDSAAAVGDFLGLPPLAAADLGRLAVAAAIIAAIAVIARLLSRRLCKWLDRTVAPKLDLAGPKLSLASTHVAASIAALAAAALLHLAAAGYRWPAYSELLFDLAIPVTAAVVAWHVALAFNLSRSIALALCFLCGFWVLSDRYEQLGWVKRSLGGFAVSLGETRISLLDLLNFAFAGVVLYALARLADRGAKAFIRGRPTLDITQSLLAEKIATVAIVVVAIFVAIDMLGIDTTALSIFSGTIGLGVGFGL